MAQGRMGRAGRAWAAGLALAAAPLAGAAPGGAGAMSPAPSAGPRITVMRDHAGLPLPEREFRGAWVASVANIDWPSRRGLPASRLREETEAILSAAQGMGLNAIVLQVRPSCDAIYPSALEPWSEFISGRSGQAPEGAAPGYDPLAEWIAGARARGIQIHAWINPFRARHHDAKAPDAPNHVTQRLPRLVRAYGNLVWLDPGEEEAQEHTLAVIADLMGRYDLDGLHVDDYFYPYPEGKKPFPDDGPFERYRAAGGGLERGAWRRDNIDRFVRRMHETVRRVRPGAAVGISPFGIWRPGFPPGVEGFDAYASLHADARRWLREGWMDYCSPQLYWPVESKQPFGRLLDWWIANNDRRVHIYPGLYTSRIGQEKAGWEPAEILRQVELTRGRAGVGGGNGTIQFSMKALMEDRQGVASALRAGPFARAALVPASPWLNPEGVGPAAAPVVRADAAGMRRLRWEAAEGEAARVAGWVVWVKVGDQWQRRLAPAGELTLDAPAQAAAAAVAMVDRAGVLGLPARVEWAAEEAASENTAR